MTEVPKFPSGTVLLRRADLRRMGIEYSNVHLLRLEARNRFPRRVRLSPAKIAWIEREVLDWLANRAAERSNYVYADY